MSVKRAQMEIDSAEFTEWIAYNRLNPMPTAVTHNLLATIASILVNVHRKKGAKVVKPEAFLPRPRARRRDTSESIYTKLRAFFNGNNR